jgi:hypothetical protein
MDTTPEDHEQILAISRIADQIADEYFGDEPDWEPLHTVLPLEWCDGFMWMYFRRPPARVRQNQAITGGRPPDAVPNALGARGIGIRRS